MPSSRHARMTRSAISPRLAIRIFLNIQSAVRARLTDGSLRDVLLEVVPAGVARAGHALHLQRELARARRVEERALVGDHALRVPVHERLVEGLHAVLHGAVANEGG